SSLSEKPWNNIPRKPRGGPYSAEKREEACQLCLDETQRFEANQAAQEKSQQLFEQNMLAVISNLGRCGVFIGKVAAAGLRSSCR
ncbi:hypothetical protein VP01_2896g1, partial [Puccinia sorghi]